MGGRPAAAARWSVGSTPAMDAKVASQSQGQVRPEERVPRCLAARAPPETHEFLRRQNGQPSAQDVAVSGRCEQAAAASSG